MVDAPALAPRREDRTGGSGTAAGVCLYLNGRFHLQALTGVQRYAAEIAAALDRLLAETGAERPVVMLSPRGSHRVPPSYRLIRHRSFGKLQGHLWEQLELPAATRDGFLVSLGNTGPVLQRRQLIVMHDANVYAHPEVYSRTFRSWYKALHRAYAHSSIQLATVSAFSKCEIAHYLGLDAGRIFGPTLEGSDHIMRVEPDRGVLGRHGLIPGRYVLTVGSLATHKNLAALAVTAAELDRRGLILAVVGSGNLAVFSANTTGAPNSARFLGRVSDGQLRALYEDAACFVFPSRHEGFGIPPLEAMACHCPVVAAAAGAVPEACGEAALYCGPDDAAGFAALVGRVIDDPGLNRSLRERGAERAKTMTWEAAARRLLAVIEKVQASEATDPPARR